MYCNVLLYSAQFIYYYTCCLCLLTCIGINFWKSPNRKLYAVARKEVHHTTVKRKCDEDSDDAESNTKRANMTIVENKLNFVLSDLEGVKSVVDDIMSVTKDSTIPLGLKKILRDTLKCRICLSAPIVPPVVITKCCKVLLGCEACVNRWYRGDDALTKPCPACKHARGYNETMILRGLDELLTTLNSCNMSQDQGSSGSARTSTLSAES